MNILVFPLSYPNELNKTANIFTKEQVAELAINNQVVVAYIQLLPTRMLFKKREKGIAEYFDGNTTVYRTQLHTFLESKFPRINGWFYKKKANSLLNYVTKKCNVDCIYAHFSIYAGWAATAYGKKNKIPVVVQEHDGKIISNKIDRTRARMLRRVCLNANEVICVSNNLKRYLEYHTGIHRNYWVIGNIIPPQFSYHPRTAKQHFQFLCVANLYKGKNVDLLIESFCKAFGPHEAVILRLCGDGEYKERLEELITNYHRDNQIYILGRVDRTQVLSEYIDCDCFVLPSDHETFGIVYREAMAVGRPIITTNHGGFDEGEFSKDHGLMIDTTEKALAHALKYIVDNYEKYDLKKISSDTLQRYKKEIVIEKIEKVIYETKQ